MVIPLRRLLYSPVIKLKRLAWRSGFLGRSWPPDLGGRGIEIGALNRPLPGIRPWYVDRYREFDGSKCPADVLADGAQVPFRDGSLDYVASSHLLEHLPDPAAAIVEWCRVVKPGGTIYMIVPDRRLTFDLRRRRTPVGHLIEDFDRGATQNDPTHIDEFFDRVDLRWLNPSLRSTDVESFREAHRAAHHRSAREGKAVNIHFHVFEADDVLDLLAALRDHPNARLRYEVSEVRRFFPPDAGNGFLVAIKKLRPGRR
jgi:SAM-dependent methyltransferase